MSCKHELPRNIKFQNPNQTRHTLKKASHSVVCAISLSPSLPPNCNGFLCNLCYALSSICSRSYLLASIFFTLCSIFTAKSKTPETNLHSIRFCPRYALHPYISSFVNFLLISNIHDKYHIGDYNFLA